MSTEDEAATVAGDAILQPGVCDDPKRVLFAGLPSGDGPFLIIHEFREEGAEDACLVLRADGAGNADPGQRRPREHARGGAERWRQPDVLDLRRRVRLRRVRGRPAPAAARRRLPAGERP